MNNRAFVLAVAACACVEWTRFTGDVKKVDLRTSTLTIQLKGGDIVAIPVDYQVKVYEKKDELRSLKDLQLNEKVTLLRVASDKPIDDNSTEGMAQPEPSPRGK